MDACRRTAMIEQNQIPRVRKGQLPEVRWKVEVKEKKVPSVLPPPEDSEFPELSVLGETETKMMSLDKQSAS